MCGFFLRIADAKNPLDNTSVHPESYKTATLLLEKLGYSLEDITGGNLSDISQRIIELVPVEVKQEKLNISGKGFEALAALKKNQRKKMTTSLKILNVLTSLLRRLRTNSKLVCQHLKILLKKLKSRVVTLVKKCQNRYSEVMYCHLMI